MDRNKYTTCTIYVTDITPEDEKETWEGYFWTSYSLVMGMEKGQQPVLDPEMRRLQLERKMGQMMDNLPDDFPKEVKSEYIESNRRQFARMKKNGVNLVEVKGTYPWETLGFPWHE